MTESADHLTVARLGKAHGVKGEVLLLPGSVDLSLFASGAVFETSDGELRIAGSRRHHQALIVRFEGIDDRSAAESLRGRALYLPIENVTLDADEWWPHDLIGLDVVSVNGDLIGSVEAVEVGASQDRLVVAHPDGRFEIPFVAALVPEVDVDSGVVVVDLPPGLVGGSTGG